MHKPRKRFGQHFLQDDWVIERLINTIAPLSGQHIVEIGPGQGALTIPILKKIKRMDVIELDRDLIPILIDRCHSHGTLVVHEADALEFNFSELYPSFRVIGNLPYNISTPLIFHLLTFANYISDMHFMLQKEVVDRIAAPLGKGNYGRLSVMVQYHCEVASLFDVPPDSFYPPPKVNSSIVRLVPYKTIPHQAKNYEHFATLVRQAFSQRRKTLRNCLKQWVSDEHFKLANIDPMLRPEQLSIKDYVNLSNISFEAT